ncbi:MAG TPA: ketoacyl-ACP synthase III, partial [Gemmatimonadaceae bacterium]|nr:ketoacyl-ACP synthase III [Gemmatimonadaceae bacterium]
VIVATGSFIPELVVTKAHFMRHEFLAADGSRIDKSNDEILQQFESITGIRERRYARPEQVTSGIGLLAAQDALASSNIDPESLDLIIFAHNFGDVRPGDPRSDLVPALAARVKSQLRIRNPFAPAFDVVFGCPGWLQGMIIADSMIRAGDVRRALIIGADTLSRISDPHDRDSLIYADGAGATILEARETDDGILAHAVRSDTLEHATMLRMGKSYNDDVFLEALFLKMEGRKLYKYALSNVAGAMKMALDRAQVPLREVDKVLIHQANGKMDEAILAALYEQEGIAAPPDVMPMTIATLGNSSVATVPTLLDLIAKNKLSGHAIEPGDVVLFASVGAGMHINAVVYRVPSVP